MANNESAVKPIGGPPSDVEHIKIESNYLRGALVETLRNPVTGGLPEDDNGCSNFTAATCRMTGICAVSVSVPSWSHLSVHAACGGSGRSRYCSTVAGHG